MSRDPTRFFLKRMRPKPVAAGGSRECFEDDHEDDYDLGYLDLPSLIDRIRYGLDNLHILKTLIEAGLG